MLLRGLPSLNSKNKKKKLWEKRKKLLAQPSQTDYNTLNFFRFVIRYIYHSLFKSDAQSNRPRRRYFWSYVPLLSPIIYVIRFFNTLNFFRFVPKCIQDSVHVRWSKYQNPRTSIKHRFHLCMDNMARSLSFTIGSPLKMRRK